MEETSPTPWLKSSPQSLHLSFPCTFFLCLVMVRISERRQFMVRILFLSHCGWQPRSTKLKPENYWSRLSSPLGTSEVTGNQLDHLQNLNLSLGTADTSGNSSSTCMLHKVTEKPTALEKWDLFRARHEVELGVFLNLSPLQDSRVVGPKESLQRP